MATPHLQKTDLGTGSGAARYPLICGDDGHLLIIRRSGGVWTDKTLIATPDKQYYSCALTFGEETSYHAGMTLGQNDADALQLQARLKNILDGQTAEDWAEGQKAIFAYWARGFPPYRLLINPSENINTLAVMNTMELAMSFTLLRFNLHAFPIGNFSAFRAFWRVWNPSLIMTDYQGGQFNPMLYTVNHGGMGYLRYKFSTHPKAPNYYQDTIDGGNYGTINIAGNANQGNTGYHAYYTTYNPWNGPATGYAAHKLYLNAQSTTTPYYADIEITGDGLTSLKSAIKGAAIGSGGDGHIYAHLGFNIADAQSATSGGMTGQLPRSVILIYASRVELKLVASWST
ncbi:MAG: hypothetical protein K6G94_09650 [Kiritimatiellae bacterium]|nr:hypothetical protein [Kiritimatiellia bacterium]